MVKKDWEKVNNTIIPKDLWHRTRRDLDRLNFNGLEKEYKRIYL